MSEFHKELRSHEIHSNSIVDKINSKTVNKGK